MSIFVSIVAYRDPMLPFTLRRAWDAAKRPQDLHFGIVDQSLPELHLTDTAPVPGGQATVIHIDASEARGPCWARALAMTLYREEEWFFQIDSHMDFEPGWDEILIEQARALQAVQPRFVISSYPPAFELVDGQPVRQPSTDKVLAHVVKPGAVFEPGHLALSFEAHPVEQDEPVRGFHVGAGCLFAPAEYVKCFPYDPYLYFQGEEQALAARLFTHGWDVFHMAGLPVSHLYTIGEAPRPLHWTEEDDVKRPQRWWQLDQRSRQRLDQLLGERRDMGVYGLGTQRTLDDYARFSGLDYSKREVGAVAYSGPWNEPSATQTGANEQLPTGLDGAYDPAAPNPLDDAWKGWVAENIARGCSNEEILGILLKERFSLASIEQAMGEKFPADSPLLPESVRRVPPPPDYLAISRPRLLRNPFGLKFQRVETDKLQLYTIDEFLSGSQCDALVSIINEHLRPSTVARVTGDPYARTSRTSDLSLLHSPVIAATDEKIAAALGIRLEYSEGNQAQRYDVGQEFKAHTDYFQPGTDEFATYGGPQGNRTWTFMIYLNEGMEGGGTRFFSVDRTFMPKKGQAIIWNSLYPDGRPNPDTLHCGLPVTAGHKIIITKWFRARGTGPMFFDD